MSQDKPDTFESEVEACLSGLAPAVTFEDRLIESLRASTQLNPFRLPHVNPLVLKPAMGVAATIAVAAIGYIGMGSLDSESASVHGMSLKQIGRNISLGSNESRAVQLGRQVHGLNQSEDRSGGSGLVDFNSQLGGAFSAGTLIVPTEGGASERRGRDLSMRSPQTDAGKLVTGSELRDKDDDVAKLKDSLPGVKQAIDAYYFKDEKLGVAENKDRPEVALGESLAPMLAPDTSANQPVAPETPPVTASDPKLDVTELPQPPTSQPLADTRKIIRTGTVEFEVQSFDAAFATLSKIVDEEAGLIGSTESTKLENGKTRGTIVVRVPPEYLDRLVMKLRGLGELKTQNISAADVTKQYTDLESQLRAAQAMQERLLEMIKDGKGAIKDLLAAEKELGNWRTKIEQLEGERRYIDAQVSLSTLSITLTEKDISQAATVTQTERVDAGIECEDVEKSRADALVKIAELGGRVRLADLKQLDAGQFTATIVAELKPESSGQLIDCLKQLGRVARLTAERSENAADGSNPTATPKIEAKPSIFQISLYNLANIAPRVTQSITLASNDVEAAYRALTDEAGKLGGRVVASEMNHPRPDSVSATMRIDVPSAQVDALTAKLKSLGIIITSTDAQATDNTSVTSAKRGFSLSLIDIAAVPPRESVNASVRVDSAGNALASLLGSVQQAGGKAITQKQSRDAHGNGNASVSVDVPLATSPTILGALQSLGTVEAIQSNQNPNVPAGELARARYDIQLATVDAIAPKDGFWNAVRNGLAISLRGLGYSLQLIVVGLCLVAPWALLVWLGVKLRRRMKSRSVPAAAQ